MADFRRAALNAGERVYRALLYLYPARFRRAFKQDLIETFRDERRSAARSGISPASFWLATLHDVVTHGTAERLASMFQRGTDHEDTLMSALSRSLRFDELRVAFRRLRRAPTFALTTTIVLALGVGATTAVFSVVNGVLLRPLPYAQPNGRRHRVSYASEHPPRCRGSRGHHLRAQLPVLGPSNRGA
jgi:hypothetical protein